MTTLNQLAESKMSDLHASIGHHLDTHIAAYKAGKMDADTLGSRTVDTHAKIAKEHGIEHAHAKKFVNDYVDSALSESRGHKIIASKLKTMELLRKPRPQDPHPPVPKTKDDTDAIPPKHQVESFSGWMTEAKNEVQEPANNSMHNQNYADAYEVGTALHLHHLTGSSTNKDKAHQARMAELHNKGREAFDKLPEHLKQRALDASHSSAKAYLHSLEHNHGIKPKDIEEIHHTSKGIGHLVGGDAPQNKNPHDVVVKTKKGEMHGASLKATAGTASNNTPSIVHGLPEVYEKGLKRAGLQGSSIADRKAVRHKPEMIAHAKKTQEEAAKHHTSVFNAMKPSEQKEHVQHLIRYNPDTKIPLDYVNGQKETSTPYHQLPHVSKTLAAKHFVAKHEKGSNLVKIHAVHPDKSEHHIATVEHRYTHGPHVAPQVNAKLSSIKE